MEQEIQESLSRLQYIHQQLGLPQSSDSEKSEEHTFEFSERLIYSEIRQLKDTISRRDKESLICTNRRLVITLNSQIYKKLKELMTLYSDLQLAYEKDNRSRFIKRKITKEEKAQREETLTVMFAQIKRLESLASENHATDRFIESNTFDQAYPILTVLPESPLPYVDDKMDVIDAIHEVEADMTENQKVALQKYEDNKIQIDKMLDVLSDGLTELKNHADIMGNEIDLQNEAMHELEFAVDHTTNTIHRDRETLQRHSHLKSRTHCGAYLCFIILILIAVIVILNILRRAFG